MAIENFYKNLILALLIFNIVFWLYIRSKREGWVWEGESPADGVGILRRDIYHFRNKLPTNTTLIARKYIGIGEGPVLKGFFHFLEIVTGWLVPSTAEDPACWKQVFSGKWGSWKYKARQCFTLGEGKCEVSGFQALEDTGRALAWGSTKAPMGGIKAGFHGTRHCTIGYLFVE